MSSKTSCERATVKDLLSPGPAVIPTPALEPYGLTPEERGLTDALSLDDEKGWAELRQCFFPSLSSPPARLNLNSGTLGTPSQVVTRAQAHFWQEGLSAYPLGQYSRGRELLRQARAQASSLWTSDATGNLQPAPALAGGTTSTFNLLTLALYAHFLERRSAIPGVRRAQVLTSQHEHYGAAAGFEHHPGFELHYLEDEALSLEGQALFQATLERIQPDIFLISQVTYTEARVLDVARLSAQVRAVVPQCWILVDSTQALGILPLPLASVVAGEVDALVSSGHKWLNGPLGSGFLWLSTRAQQSLQALHWAGEPLDDGHPMAHFEPAGGQDFSLYAGLVGALSLYTQVQEKVLPRMQLLSRHFMQSLMEMLDFHRYSLAWIDPLTGQHQQTLLEPSQLQGMFSLSFGEGTQEGIDPYPLYVQLNAQGIHTKCIKTTLKGGKRLSLLRFGIPYYESRERIQWAAQTLARLMREPR